MKKLYSVVGILLLSLSVFAVDVNKDELQSAQSESLQFENYGGPHAVIESADAITGIGTKLGEEVAADLENPLSVQPYAKYSVYHVVGGLDENGLDADILFLNATAGVDHINNLRRIITGFLMAAYGYSREDSETLALFITVYNAVYRGNLQAFSQKYKSAVLTYLTEEAVGLSTNWEDWAGKTQIVIPLGSIAAGEAVIETSEISDDKVVEALRAEDDRNVDVREKLTGIKEKESEDASEKAKAAQKEAAQEKKEGKMAEAAESSKTATEQQKKADRKNEEVKNERELIAKDREEVKKAEAEKAGQGENQKFLTSLFIVDEKNKLYSLMTVNPKDGTVVKKSPLKQIREKNIYPVDDSFVAVCGVKDKRSAVKLCLIDSVSLEIQKQSEETLSENSPLVQQNDGFLVIVTEGGKNYLASFDKNLNLKKKGTVAVNGSSPLNVYSEGILVTDEKGNPAMFSISTLEYLW